MMTVYDGKKHLLKLNIPKFQKVTKYVEFKSLKNNRPIYKYQESFILLQQLEIHCFIHRSRLLKI